MRNALRAWITDYAKGDNLGGFWRLYRRRQHAKNRLTRNILTFLLNRAARRHGGYLGNGAVIEGFLSLPHGLHGVYISRYARIGSNCRIYQNVTIGETDRTLKMHLQRGTIRCRKYGGLLQCRRRSLRAEQYGT